MFDVSLDLHSLRICDVMISIRRITCALSLLMISPNLVELEIDEIKMVRQKPWLIIYY